MKSALEILEDVEKYVEKIGGSVREKESSRLMKLLSIVLFFNKNFMSYITTVGSVIYVPKQFLDTDRNNPESYMHVTYAQVLTHEAVHVHDFKRLGSIRMSLLYLEPQLFALFSFLSIGAIWHTWMLVFLPFVAFLGPLPSHGRCRLEMRAYAMSMAFDIWYHEIKSNVPVDYVPPSFIIKQFTGWAYYKMWPIENSVELMLEMWIHLIKKNRIVDKIEIADDIKNIITEKSTIVTL